MSLKLVLQLCKQEETKLEMQSHCETHEAPSATQADVLQR